MSAGVTTFWPGFRPGQNDFSLNPSLNLCLPRVFGVVNPACPVYILPIHWGQIALFFIGLWARPALEHRTLELLFPYQNGGSKTQNQAKNELFSNIFNILAGSDPNKANSLRQPGAIHPVLYIAFHKVLHLPDVGRRFAAGPGACSNDIPVELRSYSPDAVIIQKQLRKTFCDFGSARCHHNARGLTIRVDQNVSPTWVCGSLARDNLTGACFPFLCQFRAGRRQVTVYPQDCPVGHASPRRYTTPPEEHPGRIWADRPE